MPIEFSEDLFQNNDFKVTTDNNGDLVQTHKQTGAEFKFDSTKNRWIPVQGLDLEGATIDNVGSIDIDSLGATQLSQALNANGNDITNIGQADADSLDTDDLDIGGSDFAANGDAVVTGPTAHSVSGGLSTTSSSYTGADSFFDSVVSWDTAVPSGAQGAVLASFVADGSNDQIDVRLYNVTDDETVIERTGITGVFYNFAGWTNYTPTTTGPIRLQYQIRNADGSSSVRLRKPATAAVGVQL